MLAGALHEPEHVEKVLGDVVVLLEEEHHARVVARRGELVEDPISLPPPVVLGLRELGLAVVSVEVRGLGVRAAQVQGSAGRERRGSFVIRGVLLVGERDF